MYNDLTISMPYGKIKHVKPQANNQRYTGSEFIYY
jgi:hypothetical protein